MAADGTTFCCEECGEYRVGKEVPFVGGEGAPGMVVSATYRGDLARALRRRAREEGLTVSAFVHALVERYFEAHGPSDLQKPAPAKDKSE